MSEEISKLIEKREKQDLRLSHISIQVIGTENHYSVIKRKNLYGLMRDDGFFLFPPIYDQVELLKEHNLVLIKVANKIALFSIKTAKLVTDFECDDVICHESFSTVEFVVNSKHGLWSDNSDMVLIEAQFDDVTCCSDGDFLWAYRDSHYCFLRKNDGAVINVSNALEVYDSSHNVFFLYGESGSVICLNAEGFNDSLELRKIVSQNGGRLTLRNHKKHVKDIIDVYGRILNR